MGISVCGNLILMYPTHHEGVAHSLWLLWCPPSSEALLLRHAESWLGRRLGTKLAATRGSKVHACLCRRSRLCPAKCPGLLLPRRREPTILNTPTGGRCWGWAELSESCWWLLSKAGHARWLPETWAGLWLAKATGLWLAEATGLWLAEATGLWLAEATGLWLAEATGLWLAETTGLWLAEATGLWLAETTGLWLAEARHRGLAEGRASRRLAEGGASLGGLAKCPESPGGRLSRLRGTHKGISYCCRGLRAATAKWICCWKHRSMNEHQTDIVV